MMGTEKEARALAQLWNRLSVSDRRTLVEVARTLRANGGPVRVA
jgi:hypothetical protein